MGQQLHQESHHLVMFCPCHPAHRPVRAKHASVAAKEFEAEVSVGSESFSTPRFFMLFRVSLAGGKIMETI